MQNNIKLNSLFILALFSPLFILPPITAAEQKHPSGNCLQTIGTKQKGKSPQFYFRSLFSHLSFNLNVKGHLVINTNDFLTALKSSTQNKLKPKKIKTLVQLLNEILETERNEVDGVAGIKTFSGTAIDMIEDLGFGKFDVEDFKELYANDLQRAEHSEYLKLIERAESEWNLKYRSNGYWANHLGNQLTGLANIFTALEPFIKTPSHSEDKNPNQNQFIELNNQEVFLLYSILIQYELWQKISTNPQKAYNLLKISYPKNNDQVLNNSLVKIQKKFNTFLFFPFLLTQN